MPNAAQFILTINGGSSSIKFALYAAADPTRPLISGKIERIGLPDSLFAARDAEKKVLSNQTISIADHATAGHFLIDWLEKEIGLSALIAVGHRVVHGGVSFTQPQRVTPELLV